MKLSLINPERNPEQKGDFFDFRFEKRILNQIGLIPLALPTIAGATPDDVETRIIDEQVEEINFDEEVDIVGIGAMTPKISRAYEIADEFRQRGVKVVLGGIHASMLPHEAAQHADCVVVGEADHVWKDVIADYKKGKMNKFYNSERYPELTEIKAPRYDLLKIERYVVNQVQTTRGCPYDCDFCSVKVFSGEKFRPKTTEQVITEIEKLNTHYEIDVFGNKLKLPKTLFFADDNIIGNRKSAKQLFEALIPLKISEWYCQASINVGKDKEMLDLMKAAGCQQMVVGIESVNPETLKGFNKKVNKVDEFYENIHNIQSAGIKVLGSFILGSDNDDESIFEKTVKFIRENNLIFNMVSILTPLPGTRLFDQFESEGRILHKNWKHFDFETVCFKPKNMSAETLENGRRWVYEQIYDLNNIQTRYDNFLAQKTEQKIEGFEKSFGDMPMRERILSLLLVIKILYKLNGKQKKFLFNTLKKYVAGQETNLGNSIAQMSWNEYATNL